MYIDAVQSCRIPEHSKPCFILLKAYIVACKHTSLVSNFIKSACSHFLLKVTFCLHFFDITAFNGYTKLASRVTEEASLQCTVTIAVKRNAERRNIGCR